MTRGHRILGAVDLLVGAMLAAADLLALPMRWLPVDALLLSLALLFAVAGVALLAGASWARRAALVAGGVALLAGLSLTTALVLSAAHLFGLYGPVGQGGAILLGVVAALVVPYLVLLPVAQLWVLLPPSKAPP